MDLPSGLRTMLTLLGLLNGTRRRRCCLPAGTSHRSHQRGVWSTLGAAAERREVVLADEVLCCRVHLAQIQRGSHMPLEVGVSGIEQGSVANPVLVGPTDG